jgi:hypothetical protein
MSIYRTRNGDLSLSSIKNSITEILPNKSADSIERNKFEQSQVNLHTYKMSDSLK